MATLDRGNADPGVVVAHVQVNALADLVAEAAHRLLGDRAQVERVGRGLAPVRSRGPSEYRPSSVRRTMPSAASSERRRCVDDFGMPRAART